MPSIDIRRPHSKSIKDAKAAVNHTAAAMTKKLDVKTEWQANTLHFTRSGVNGTIAISKGEIHVHAELGFLFGALKPMIEGEINRRLDEDFGKSL